MGKGMREMMGTRRMRVGTWESGWECGESGWECGELGGNVGNVVNARNRGRNFSVYFFD